MKGTDMEAPEEIALLQRVVKALSGVDRETRLRILGYLNLLYGRSENAETDG